MHFHRWATSSLDEKLAISNTIQRGHLTFLVFLVLANMDQSVVCTLSPAVIKEQLTEQGIDFDLWELISENKLPIIQGITNDDELSINVMISSQISIQLKFPYQKIGDLPFHMEIVSNLLAKILQFSYMLSKKKPLKKTEDARDELPKARILTNFLGGYDENEINDILKLIFPPPVELNKLTGSQQTKNVVELESPKSVSKKRLFGKISR